MMQLEYGALTFNKGAIVAELPLAQSFNPSSPRLKAVLSLRSAGNLKLEQVANRQQFYKTAGIPPERAYALRQVHAKQVHVADASAACYDKLGEGAFSRGTYQEGDGFITNNKEAILGITVADCLPIFLFDREKETFGLVHSGWQGTGIVKEAIYLMQQHYGTNPAALSITIGPGIGPCCYNVPLERYAQFKTVFGEEAVYRKGEQYFLDLKATNINLLKTSGVPHVQVIEDCTFCNPLLSSFRRDGKENLSVMLACLGYF
jgi:hypothetical protein